MASKRTTDIGVLASAGLALDRTETSKCSDAQSTINCTQEVTILDTTIGIDFLSYNKDLLFKLKAIRDYEFSEFYELALRDIIKVDMLGIDCLNTGNILAVKVDAPLRYLFMNKRTLKVCSIPEAILNVTLSSMSSLDPELLLLSGLTKDSFRDEFDKPVQGVNMCWNNFCLVYTKADGSELELAYSDCTPEALEDILFLEDIKYLFGYDRNELRHIYSLCTRYMVFAGIRECVGLLLLIIMCKHNGTELLDYVHKGYFSSSTLVCVQQEFLYYYRFNKCYKAGDALPVKMYSKGKCWL